MARSSRSKSKLRAKAIKTSDKKSDYYRIQQERAKRLSLKLNGESSGPKSTSDEPKPVATDEMEQDKPVVKATFGKTKSKSKKKGKKGKKHNRITF